MLLLAEYQIYHPAAANVLLLRIAAVVENVVMVAARILDRVGQNGHRGEVAGIVHLAGEGYYTGARQSG
jgi:hypothetical protein